MLCETHQIQKILWRWMRMCDPKLTLEPNELGILIVSRTRLVNGRDLLAGTCVLEGDSDMANFAAFTEPGTQKVDQVLYEFDGNYSLINPTETNL